jgi:hypothetical protein
MHTAAPSAEAQRPLLGRANNAAEEEHAGMSYVWSTLSIMLSRGAAEQIPHTGEGPQFSYLDLSEGRRSGSQSFVG